MSAKTEKRGFFGGRSGTKSSASPSVGRNESKQSPKTHIVQKKEKKRKKKENKKRKKRKKEEKSQVSAVPVLRSTAVLGVPA
jgi:hypothetical protein